MVDMQREATRSSNQEVFSRCTHGIELPNLFDRENLSILGPTTTDILSEQFFTPLMEYLDRPRKNFRAQLVETGACLVDGLHDSLSMSSLEHIKNAVECLHAGSLIIDDIQDGSIKRRGQPAFHIEHNSATAICTGNWMYFWPLRLLEKVDWSHQQKESAFDHFHRALELAHYGQFLDLSVKANIEHLSQLAEISIKAAHLKTGTITALSFVLGALASGATEDHIKAIAAFGTQFGIVLQRLDDWGNLLSNREAEKRFEDLRGRKPSTVWHDLHYLGSPADKEEFADAIASLPDPKAIIAWLDESSLPEIAISSIESHLKASLETLKNKLGASLNEIGFIRLKHISEELLVAYR